MERRWLVVVLALALTGLGAAITGLLYTSGINMLRDWRLDLLDEFPAWVVLPALGAIGGMVSAWLITNLSPAAGGAGITHICLLYTSPSPRDRTRSRMPSSA